MLPCVSHVKLPALPKQVVLHHYVQGGVAITAVAYARSAAPNYFTVAELSTPNVEGVPMRVTHVRAPGHFISQLAVGHSLDGANVFVVAQCCTRQTDAEGGAVVASKVLLYRRDVDIDEETASEQVCYRRMPRSVAGLDTVVSSEKGASACEVARVWTAALALNGADNAVDDAAGRAGAPSHASSSSPSAMRVVGAAGGGTSGQPVCLQILSIAGTRGALEFTVELPFLSGFVVEEMASVPGCVDRLVLRCHHVLVEVDLSLCERILVSQKSVTDGASSSSAAPLVRTNEVVTRVWRWSPHDRLTGFTLKDAHVYATTEEGVVLLWDYQSGASAVAQMTAGSTSPQPSEEGARQHPQCHSIATGVAHTGIYAPYATDFVTCGVDGSVLSWNYSNLQDALEAGVAGLSALSDFAQAAADAAVEKAFPYTPSPADGDRTVPYLPQTLLRAYALDGSGDGGRARASAVVTESTGAKRYNGGVGADGAGRTQHADAVRQAALSLGRQLRDTRTLPGSAGESCVGLSGDGNLLSVVGDYNTLRVYLCQ